MQVETKVRCCASFQASLRHPVIFSEGKLSRGAGLLSMHLPRPPLPKASCEARSGSIFAHVSRATTAHQGTSYWIAARTISRARYLLYVLSATVTLPHSFLRFSSIPVADFILRRRRFPTRVRTLWRRVSPQRNGFGARFDRRRKILTVVRARLLFCY